VQGWKEEGERRPTEIKLPIFFILGETNSRMKRLEQASWVLNTEKRFPQAADKSPLSFLPKHCLSLTLAPPHPPEGLELLVEV
jgi:hypothetical protein